jgi:hypothetical protein
MSFNLDVVHPEDYRYQGKQEKDGDENNPGYKIFTPHFLHHFNIVWLPARLASIF